MSFRLSVDEIILGLLGCLGAIGLVINSQDVGTQEKTILGWVNLQKNNPTYIYNLYL